MKKYKEWDQRILGWIGAVFVGVMALAAVLPFFLLIVNSFASEKQILNNGYSLWPKEFSLASYKLIFDNPQRILQSYAVSLFITVFGTVLSLFFSAMTAYVLARKDVKYRGQLAFFLYFTQLFWGGLVPFYLLVTKYLHLQNTLTILLLTQMFNVLNILILRSFLQASIPQSLYESSKIDGAGDFRIFMRIVLPLSGPALASIGLFTALNYWNDWWTPMMFIQKEALFPLQYSLYQILSSVNFTAAMVANAPHVDLPKETLKLAMTVVATGPIILLYPFVQRFFVKGVTLGSVKG